MALPPLKNLTAICKYLSALITVSCGREVAGQSWSGGDCDEEQQEDRCHLIDAAEATARAIAIHDPRTVRPYNLHEQLGGCGDNVLKYLYGWWLSPHQLSESRNQVLILCPLAPAQHLSQDLWRNIQLQHSTIKPRSWHFGSLKHAERIKCAYFNLQKREK